MKINKTTLSSLLIILLILLPLTNMPVLMYVALMIACFIYMGNSFCYKNVRGKKIKRLSIICLTIIAMIILMQAFVIRSDSALLDTIKICTQVYIGVIVVFFLGEAQDYETAVTEGFSLSILLFSIIYIINILINGIDNGRASMFGIVSKNYCAALIYFCIPLVMYKMKQEKMRRKKRLYIASIVLGTVTVLLTGSRTSLGVISMLFIIHYLFGKKTKKDFTKAVFLICFLVAVLLVSYHTIPIFHDSIERALGALRGINGIRNDVRMVLWGAAISDWRDGNTILGSGTNVISPFAFEEPVHNYFLETLLAFGVLGIVVIVVFVFVYFITMSKNYRYREVGVPILQLAVAFIITSILQPFFSTSYALGIIIWLSFGALLSNRELMDIPKKSL